MTPATPGTMRWIQVARSSRSGGIRKPIPTTAAIRSTVRIFIDVNQAESTGGEDQRQERSRGRSCLDFLIHFEPEFPLLRPDGRASFRGVAQISLVDVAAEPSKTENLSQPLRTRIVHIASIALVACIAVWHGWRPG